MARKSGCFGKAFKYAATRTMYETVRNHNRRVRPQISAKEDALLAYMAYRTANMMFYGK